MHWTLCLLALHANDWERLPRADVAGQRGEPPLVWSSAIKRFVVAGGRTHWGNYPKPRPYDVLELDGGEWHNAFPPGKDWGPAVGLAKAPGWKSERWGFTDAAGNTRPNWTIYGSYSLGTCYASDGERILFYFAGSTFAYDPAKRTWADLAPANHPEKECSGRLLWSSLCRDASTGEFLLFGGGNVQTLRGDPGTWLYSTTMNRWRHLMPEAQPPQRAHSQLAYDPVAKKAVLFGGDQLDALLADTWLFDSAKKEWTQAKPPSSPSPRAGHALLWLPQAKQILLLGGFGYASGTGYMGGFYARKPLEAWLYDTKANEWRFLKRWGKEAPQGPANGVLRAAVNDKDEVLVLAQDGSTWRWKVDAAKPEGKASAGVKPGTTERRKGPYAPAWFKEGVPAPEPKKVAALLEDLPPNTWVEIPSPKRPAPNMDWGSAVYDASRGLILRFSGGHSAYSGTAPIVYGTASARWSLPFAPEVPLEFHASNDQVRGEWSFKGNPWMTGHTYKATGYDPFSRTLVFAPKEFTYFFDPEKGKWSRSAKRNPFRPDCYTLTLCTTPDGLVAWGDRRGGGEGLWRLSKEREWQSLPLKGRLHDKSADRHGMAYDSKRGRLLLFSALGRDKGDVLAYDPKSGAVKRLEAKGRAKAALSSRETVYLPDADAVLVGARLEGRWLLYDCAANEWKTLKLAGNDPIRRGAFNNSMGLMFDPKRKLVWAVGQNSQVYALRLDLSKAEVEGLGKKLSRLRRPSS